MNKTAQTFLGLAIAIIFPVFVLYAAVTFVPSTDGADALVGLYRALIGVGMGVLGLLAVFAVMNISSLVYGLSSGAGLTLLGGITALLLSAGDSYQSVVSSTLLVLFIALMALALVYERRFPEDVTPAFIGHDSVPTPPSAVESNLIHPDTNQTTPTPAADDSHEDSHSA